MCYMRKFRFSHLSTSCLYRGISRAYNSLFTGESWRQDRWQWALSLLQHLSAFSFFPALVHLLTLHAHSHHNEVTAREVKRLIAVLTRPTLCSDVVQESMKVCAITERTASTLSVTCTSKTNWGFFKMLTQKRKGKLRAEDKTKVHLNIKVAHFLPDEFPWPFQSFAITE